MHAAALECFESVPRTPPVGSTPVTVDSGSDGWRAKSLPLHMDRLLAEGETKSSLHVSLWLLESVEMAPLISRVPIARNRLLDLRYLDQRELSSSEVLTTYKDHEYP